MSHDNANHFFEDDLFENHENGGMIQERQLIVFCHLRWEFVTQRPQHIISRLARHRKVLFVEEPIGHEAHERGTAHLRQVAENIQVLQPRTGYGRFTEEIAPVVLDFMKREQWTSPILWFYSAAFGNLADQIPHSLLVYDCMDELSAFKGAPQSLITQEKRLLAEADVVFTGGKSLYEAKRLLSDKVHCYPSSVDSAHFEQALHPTTVVPADMKSIAHPIVGYYGVIDERIDYELLGAVARQNPEVSFVMIGPVVKVDPADLPKAANLHYLGGKDYSELPAYLKGFDVAMMPFALNESTKFISPTKTLEYIAAQKPIISTPIYDVVRDYGEVLPIVETPAQFSTALADFLREDDAQREVRLRKYETILQAVSWDKTVAAMEQNLAEASAAATI